MGQITLIWVSKNQYMQYRPRKIFVLSSPTAFEAFTLLQFPPFPTPQFPIAQSQPGRHRIPEESRPNKVTMEGTDESFRLHLAVVVLPHVEGQHMFPVAGRFSCEGILCIIRELEPEHTVPDDFLGGDDPTDIEQHANAEALLRSLGRPGWISLRDLVAASTKGRVRYTVPRFGAKYLMACIVHFLYPL